MIQSLHAENNEPSNPATASVSNPAATPSTALPPTKATAASTPSMAMQKPQESSTQKGERSSYSSVHVDGPYISMTFDDGPRANGKEAYYTPKLLDMLKERKIHATFFVVGNMVKEHPEILKREIEEGHEVGNHSWDHKQLTSVIQKEGGLDHEIADTSALIKEVTGKAPALIRPPYGATTPSLSRAIEKQYGMKVILWTVDPLDWDDKHVSPKMVEDRILNGWKQSPGVKAGYIILSHDTHKGTIEAMATTLDALIAKGYKFVTVSELLALESKNPAPTPSASPSSSPSAQKSSKSKKRQS